MARIRSIKPEFWTSEQVADCSPTARLLFIGLWTFSDDGGVHPFSTKRIKMEVFPGDDFEDDQLVSLIDELLSVGLLRSFTVDGQRFLVVTGWRHQKIEKPTYRWPQPNEATEFDNYPADTRGPVAENSANGRRAVGDASPPEGSGGEGKGEERSKTHCAPDQASPAGSHDKQFVKFWETYPPGRRKDRRKAFKAWQGACKRADANTIIAAAAEYAMSDEGRGEFVKMPSTWLNGDCWADDRQAWKSRNGHAHTTNRVGAGQRYGGE